MDICSFLIYDLTVLEADQSIFDQTISAGVLSNIEQENVQMEKQKQPNRRHVPQLKIRTSLAAGGSLDNCLQNLNYWQKRYNQMCRFK